MKRKNIYLVLALIGFVAPYYFFLQVRAFNLSELFRLFSASNILSGLAMDLLVSVIVFWFFIFTEAKKLQMKNPWVYLLATLLVGLSFALPLFLYFRERRLESRAGAGQQELVDPWSVL
jgi:hypothetical protein